MNTVTWLVLLALLLLAVVTVSVSLNILFRGKIYHWLKPKSRPRRWVLIALLVLFAVFAVWFPVWMMWRQSLVAKGLTLIFVIVFVVVGLTLKWLDWAVDWYFERKGWPLR